MGLLLRLQHLRAARAVQVLIQAAQGVQDQLLLLLVMQRRAGGLAVLLALTEQGVLVELVLAMERLQT